jgi:hypothetical protein
MRAVVVEPDEALAVRIVEALGARGWSALTARGYLDGLELLRRARAITALCVAERLARFSGPDLLAALEREPGLGHIPAVLRVSQATSMVARALVVVGGSVVSVADPDVIADAVLRVAARPGAPGLAAPLHHGILQAPCECSRSAGPATSALGSDSSTLAGASLAALGELLVSHGVARA